MDENTDAIPTDEIQLDFAIFVGRRATTDLEQDIVIDSNSDGIRQQILASARLSLCF